MDRVVYADNNATTRVAPEVFEAITPFLTGDYFNPSSMYDPARGPADAIAAARATNARHLGGVNLGFLDGHAANLYVDTAHDNFGQGWKSPPYEWYLDPDDPDYDLRFIAP